MPITINYNPAAEALAQVAFQGGRGQFQQKRDEFAFDVARFGEQQRQFDVGTRLNIEELDRRDRLAQFQAAVTLEQQRQAMIGRERAQAFDAMVQQQAEAQAIQAKAQQDQLDRLRAIADQQRDMEFTAYLAKQKQVAQAIQNGTLRTPQEVQEVTMQLQAEAQRLGIPGPGAEQFGRPQPDPMEVAGQQAEAINQNVYGGEPIAFVQPDGQIAFMPYQNTPSGIRLEHESKMEIERLKQEQEDQKLQAEQQKQEADDRKKEAEQAEKKRNDVMKEINTLQADRRKQEMEASLSEEPGAAGKTMEQWDKIYGPELNRLRGELRAMREQAPVAIPQQQQGGPAPTQQGTLDPNAVYPQLPPVMSDWTQDSANAMVQAFLTSESVGTLADQRARTVDGARMQAHTVDQWMQNLYRWTLEEHLPFIQDPDAVASLPPNSWYIGVDFRKHRVPGRAVNAILRNGVTDFIGSIIRANLEGLSDAALGLYDSTGA